jgi:NADH-quinone oxidoreductase subunit A
MLPAGRWDPAFSALMPSLARSATDNCPDPTPKRRVADMNLDAYLPVILFILVGAVVGVLPQVLGFVLGPHRPDAAKASPYECGFEAFEDARMKFDVRYYLVAILFILFDLEIAFLFPWAVSLDEIGASGFWAMMIFLGILVVGFAYEWKKGALDWE